MPLRLIFPREYTYVIYLVKFDRLEAYLHKWVDNILTITNVKVFKQLSMKDAKPCSNSVYEANNQDSDKI